MKKASQEQGCSSPQPIVTPGLQTCVGGERQKQTSKVPTTCMAEPRMSREPDVPCHPACVRCPLVHSLTTLSSLFLSSRVGTVTNDDREACPLQLMDSWKKDTTMKWQELRKKMRYHCSRNRA